MKFLGRWRKETQQQKEETPFDGPPPLPAKKSTEAPIGQGRKILVIDDNPTVLKAFELKLKSLGFTVVTECEGAPAVTKARLERPDIIVLDINFPPDVGNSGLQWDGFSIMQWMKRFQEAAAIPVVIITSGDPKLREKALAAGAVAFFQKPINNEEFLVTLRRVMGQPGTARAI